MAWLFCDTPVGALASATLYSIVETARANGQEPYRYLCHLFDSLPGATTAEAVEVLLPYQLKPTDYRAPRRGDESAYYLPARPLFSGAIMLILGRAID